LRRASKRGSASRSSPSREPKGAAPDLELAVTITDEETYRLFEKEYDAIGSLLLSRGPSFEEVIEKIRSYAETF
jgi:hypothetical protein